MKMVKRTSMVLIAGLLFLSCDRGNFSDGAGAVRDGIQAAGLTPAGKPVSGGSAAVQDIARSRQNAITKAVAKVSPAVVGISTEGVQRYRVDDFWSFFYPGGIYHKFSALGSGFVISPDGYIVTNDHVLENAQKITVTMTDQKKYTAKIVNRDFASDIALLKIEGDNFPYVQMGNSDDILVGEWVIAFGNPFGLFEINDQPSVTVGVISAARRDFGKNADFRYYNNMIQTDASINPGNSGGPLVNSEGDVIGVNSFIYTGSSTQEGSIGLGFAIPINKVREVVDKLKATAGEDKAVYTGISAYAISRMLQWQLGLSTRDGALIYQIDADSPGEKAGLRVGDVIVKINGTRVGNPDEINAYLDRIGARAGMALTIQVIRENRLYETKLTLEKPPGKEQGSAS